MSDNGQKMFAANFQKRLYLSSDGGATWAEAKPAGNSNFNWYTVSVSGDGETLFAGVQAGRLFVSTNGGISWSETQPAGNTNQPWLWLTTSYDGLTTYAITDITNKVYKTTNRGGSWTETLPTATASPYFTTISMSTDTRTIFVTAMTGKMYLSDDSGTTWVQDPFVSNNQFGWIIGYMSRDGTQFYVGEWLGRLYHGFIPQITPTVAPTTAAVTPTCTGSVPAGTVDLFQINRTNRDAQLFFTPVQKVNQYNVMYGYKEGDERFGAISQETANDTGVQSVTIHGLDSGRSYWFKVVPMSGCATGNWSNWMKVGTSRTKRIFYK